MINWELYKKWLKPVLIYVDVVILSEDQGHLISFKMVEVNDRHMTQVWKDVVINFECYAQR